MVIAITDVAPERFWCLSCVFPGDCLGGRGRFWSCRSCISPANVLVV